MKTIKTMMMLAAVSVGTVVGAPTESEDTFKDRTQWFTEAKFGLFIHYGVYSTLGGEWNGKPVPRYAEWIQRWGEITPDEYIPLAADFQPVNLDADAWVRRARDAGMKYMVITSKHHEGFCLWDSAHTEYDLGEATTFDRDILGELNVACKKYGLKFGTYYSIIDWHHPSQRVEKCTNQPPMRDKAAYVTYMKAQLKELIERYDPAVMWFDGDWAKWWTMEDGTDLYNYLRELSPDMVINNRVAKRAVFKKDFGTPEQQTPGTALDHLWEACWTVNHSWGFKKSDTKWKSTEELIRKQIDINTKGGNLLLNVGPKADGSWPSATVKQLEEMGVWNQAHAEAIYGTEFVEAPVQSWGKLSQVRGSTMAEGELLAYVFDRPQNGKLVVKGVAFDEVQARTHGKKPLPVAVTAGGVEIDLSSVKAEPFATVVRLTYKGRKETAPALDPKIKLKGDELVLEGRKARVSGKANRIEENSHVGYWTDPSDTASWDMEVPAPGKFAVKILYSCEKTYRGSDVVLTVGGKTLTSKVEPTAGWKQFELMDMGVVTLDQVGTTTCKVGFGEHKGKALFNLKTILFVPMAE